MRARLSSSSLAIFASLVACASGAPSKLDSVQSTRVNADPWAMSAVAGEGGAGGDTGKADGPLGGLDLKQIFDKLKDNIEKPGPYEAPPKSADFDLEKPYWAVMELGGDVVERKAYALRGGGGTELRELVGRLRDLAKNDKLVGLLLRVDGMAISVPDLVELRVALHDFRAAGKQLACHAEAASDATYLMMTACDKIGLAPLGQIAITGPSAMPVHLKPLLDKFGVTADFLHVGAYKGAAEPLTRDAPSKEMEETLGAILDGRYDTLVAIVAKDRHLDVAGVKSLVDTGLFPSEQAKAVKLVDEVASFEAFRTAVVGKAPWTELEVAKKDDDIATMLKLMRFIGAVPGDRPAVPHVAVIYATGDIVDGDGDGVIGARQHIASKTLVATLRALTADANVAAVVLRIDSGGGSAQASELIWQAVEELHAKKPVVVSMSDVAASGGYYIASGADRIFALPDTLTGSIGVVGGRISLGPALARFGVNAYPMGRGKHATMMSSMKGWTDDERAVIQTSMEEVYKVFVGRVAAGRKKTPEQIQPIAQGRVWTGTRAKELGLVDELGGLDEALAEARKLGKIDATVELEVYPSAPTLRDFLAGYGAVHAPMGLSALAQLAGLTPATARDAISALDPVVGEAVGRMLELAMSFRQTSIQTVTILPLLK
ncbi:MAG: signal peptide peptidase SppA [Proteobacteria bacterium]|nr:signal peptide peptidase SppA [Pseudomonadota bacterium]